MTSTEQGIDALGRPGHDPRRAAAPGVAARLLLLPINGYRRWISPLLPPSCRFYPSCSAYAVQALTTHGALRGSWLTAGRLLRCGPWHPGGFDPVPPRPPHDDQAGSRSDRVRPTSAEE